LENLSRIEKTLKLEVFPNLEEKRFQELNDDLLEFDWLPTVIGKTVLRMSRHRFPASD
jgi:hypothetical protein